MHKETQKSHPKVETHLNEQDSVQASVVLGVVCDLGPTTPDDLSTSCDQTELGNVDFDDGTLGQNTKLGVHGVLRVLLDGNDGELDGDTEFGVGDIGLLVTETHGTDESANCVSTDVPEELEGREETNLSYFTGRRVKSGPTKVGLVIILFQLFFAVFFPVLTTLNISSSAIPLTLGSGTLNLAAFSALLFLMAEERAFAFFSLLRSSR